MQLVPPELGVSQEITQVPLVVIQPSRSRVQLSQQKAVQVGSALKVLRPHWYSVVVLVGWLEPTVTSMLRGCLVRYASGREQFSYSVAVAVRPLGERVA